MSRNRMEAFSDAVLAIIMTIMVLELAAPEDAEIGSLGPLASTFLSYVLSFVFLGIYWNNHHHLLQAISHVDGRVLWSNMHLLFWLTLIPFVTAWMGDTDFATWPVVIYGVVLLLASIAFYILVRALIALHGEAAVVTRAVGRDMKGKASPILYMAAIGLAFVSPWIACAMYVVVALMWIVPDRRIERLMSSTKPESSGGE